MRGSCADRPGHCALWLRVVAVDDRGRYDGLDGNWYIDEGRRLWASIDLRF